MNSNPRSHVKSPVKKENDSVEDPLVKEAVAPRRTSRKTAIKTYAEAEETEGEHDLVIPESPTKKVKIDDHKLSPLPSKPTERSDEEAV